MGQRFSSSRRLLVKKYGWGRVFSPTVNQHEHRVLKSAALSCEVPIKFHLVLISDMAQWISAFTSLSDNL